MKFLMILAISFLATNAFADSDQELSPSQPDITTPTCGAHAYFAPNTNIVIVEIPTDKCDSFRTAGSDLEVSAGRITRDGRFLRISIEARPHAFINLSVMNLEKLPFRVDQIRVYFP